MSQRLVSATPYRLTFLSPVHVGTAERLGRHDFIVVQSTLYRLNPVRLLAELEQAPQTRDRYLTGGLQQIESWLRQGDRWKRLSLYSCTVPRQPGPSDDLRPFLADPLGRPYIPGTELKGAIRTAVLWHLVSVRSDREQLAALVGRRRGKGGQPEDQSDRRYAGQWLEQTLLGEDPRDDTFRLLRVADTTGTSPAALRVYPVLVAARQRAGLSLLEQPRFDDNPGRYGADPNRAVVNFCECLDRGELTTTVELDRYLLSQWKRDASFLERWPEACNTFSRHVAQVEQAWWQQAAASAGPSVQGLATAVAQFYTQLLQRLQGLRPGQAILNLGWGGGWRTKTVTDAFGDRLVDQVVRRYNLDRRSGSRPFPKTRKVAWLGGDKLAPLGWVLLEPVGGGE